MYRALFAFGFLALSSTAAWADDAFSCADFLAAYRATAVAPVTETTPDDCVHNHLQAFTLNSRAVANATPATDLDDLVGTWLGDDLSTSITGAMTPGQEVLHIEPGADTGTLLVRQYWYKVNLPPIGSDIWDDSLSYVGQVSEAVVRLDTQGRFQPVDPYEGVTYFSTQVQFRRANALYVLARLNHFERDGQFLRDDDTLVLVSNRFPIPPSSEVWTNAATFTRVADGTPDTALRLVQILDLGQTQYFDCLAHQLSDASGPLLEAIAPATVADLDTVTRDLIAVNRSFMQAYGRLRTASDAERPELRAELGRLQNEQMTTMRSPIMAQLIAAMQAQALGCPSNR